jgi:peptidyl-prolyl cis-trans isomerase C
MRSTVRPWLAAVALAGVCWSASAQPPASSPQAPRPASPAPPAPTPGVAATVNGQPIPEKAVQRGLKRVDPQHHAEARAEILGVLIDNVVIDQHLMQLNITVEAKDVEARLQQIKDEVAKQAKKDLTFEKVLEELMLTEAELKQVITSDMRWEKFTAREATEKVLQDYFTNNKEVFDGSLVHARHILIKTADNSPQAADKVKAELLQIKKDIEKKVSEETAKVPATADALAREQARAKALEEAFAAAAREKSACPSKQDGGDVNWFPRAGSMVEPFAKVAFALKPYELSDVVQTQFGYHLLLVVDRKPGRDVKYDDMKNEIREVYCERLREQLCAQLRTKAAIVINPAPKTAPATEAKPTPKP